MKAFNKVDHNIFVTKLAENKIIGKLGMWIIEFLINRKFRVLTNGQMFEEQDMKSEGP